MPEMRLAAVPSRAELLRQLRARIGALEPGLRVVAQELLGLDARIDLVAVDASGRAVLVLVGVADEDLVLVGRALAQRSWVEARLGDWLQLAPDLGVRPEAGTRALILCPGFGAEARAAAGALGPAVSLVRYVPVRNGERELLIEKLFPEPGAALPDAEPPAPFRSGLSDRELALTAEERAEFQPA